MVSRRRVVVTGTSFSPSVTQALRDHGLEIEIIPGDLEPRSIVATLDGAWGYVLGGSERMTKEVWDQLPKLAVVCVLGTGYRSFIELPEHECTTWFTYTPHANAEAVAEFTVALALDLVRGVTVRATEVTAGRWNEATTRSLLGARVGVAGMGHVGRAASRILTAGFGAEVMYWNRTPRLELESLGYPRARSLQALCEQVEILIVSMAHSSGDNDGIIGELELRALGKNSVLINVAAAGLLDPSALRTVLEHGQLWAVALDGYYQNPTPLPDEDLYGLMKYFPRLLVTPHCASLTHQAMDAMAGMAAENLLAVLGGDVPPYCIPGMARHDANGG